MRPVLILLPLLGLAACATPQQLCVAQASQDLAIIDSLINQTRVNIQRGYGVETRQEVRSIPGICNDDDDDYDWDGVWGSSCSTTYVRDVHQPVALDLRAEQDKLRQLEQQRDRLAAPTDAALRQCLAIYPE